MEEPDSASTAEKRAGGVSPWLTTAAAALAAAWVAGESGDGEDHNAVRKAAFAAFEASLAEEVDTPVEHELDAHMSRRLAEQSRLLQSQLSRQSTFY